MEVGEREGEFKRRKWKEEKSERENDSLRKESGKESDFKRRGGKEGE